MSTTPTTETPDSAAAIAELTKERDGLARCVIFAVNHADFKGGCVLRKTDDGGIKTESWMAWFRRELAPLGVTWDDDLLSYGRASAKNRKMMLKENPNLAAKLAAHK